MVETPAATTARDPCARDDPIADAQRRHLIAALNDPPYELVSEYDAGTAENGTVIPFRRVGPTDRCAEHLEHDVAMGRGGGVRNILNSDIARSVKDSGPHEISTRSGP